MIAAAEGHASSTPALDCYVNAMGGPPDGSGATYAQMLTADGLAAIRAYADAIAPSQNLVIDPNAAIFPAPTTLVLDAHNAGLSVHTWTAKAENMFLPKLLQKGDRITAKRELEAAIKDNPSKDDAGKIRELLAANK